jgi:TonB family protein
MAIPIGETMIGDPALKKGDSDKFIKPQEPVEQKSSIEVISEMPRLIKEVKPRYPEEARRLGIEGSVVLLLEIDEKGNVVSAKVIKKMGYGMDEEALKAAYALKFAPAMAGKTPVRAKIKYTFTFILED